MASSRWQQAGETIASEFSDLPGAEQATRVMVRLAEKPEPLLNRAGKPKGKP